MTDSLTPRTKDGRPLLLTDETHRRIVDAVRAGNYLKIAAQAAGVSQATLAAWLARGRAAAAAREAGAEPSADDTPFLELLEEVTRAQASAEVAAVVSWRRAFTGDDPDWRAARDYLARTAPERWAGVTRVQMTTEEAERRIDDAVNEALLSLGVDTLDDDEDLDESDDALD
jgi:hypothetical protein